MLLSNTEYNCERNKVHEHMPNNINSDHAKNATSTDPVKPAGKDHSKMNADNTVNKNTNETANKDSNKEPNKESTPNSNVTIDSLPEKFRKITADGPADKMTKKPAKKSLYADSNLDMLSMSRKERRAVRKELYSKNTEGMSRKEKASYFFDYYKWQVIIPVVIVVFVAFLAHTIYMNKRPVALGFAILNVQDTDSVDLSFEDDYINYFDITGSYQFKESLGLDIDYDYYKEHEDYIQTSNSTDYSILSSDCDLGSNDVIISNDTGLRYCASENIVKPLKGYLSEAVYAALEPYMVSYEDPSGTERAYAIDISNTQFVKNLDLGYADVYVAFPGAIDRNYTNSLRFLEYVLGIELPE